jgi:hypothetical protein
MLAGLNRHQPSACLRHLKPPTCWVAWEGEPVFAAAAVLVGIQWQLIGG